jgi:hypothetical protein
MAENNAPKCSLCHKAMHPVPRTTDEKEQPSNSPRKWQCDDCMALRTTIW